jgi:hypothetical protein
MTESTVAERTIHRGTASSSVERYLDMADRCRRMAATVRRPANLLLRAEHFERAAADLDQRAATRCQ